MRQLIVVSLNFDPAMPIAVYMQRANGGVIPSIAPVITGNMIAARSGFPPAAAKIAMMVVPKIFV